MNRKTYSFSTIQKLWRYFFIAIIVCLSSFSNQHLHAAEAPSLLKTWYSESGDMSWRFANDELGQRFIYTKDTLRIIGTWELGEKNLSLNYKWNAIDLSLIHI